MNLTFFIVYCCPINGCSSFLTPDSSIRSIQAISMYSFDSFGTLHVEYPIRNLLRPSEPSDSLSFKEYVDAMAKRRTKSLMPTIPIQGSSVLR